MSRSYRRPYSAVTGAPSAAWDKMTAARGMRRAQNKYVHNLSVGNLDWDEIPIPVRLECHHNNVWCWGRDGKQRLQRLNHNDLNPYYRTMYFSGTEQELFERHFDSLERQVRWIQDIQRK